jgi:prepilin-type N-terminal cleavage/methylation domain-containing protein
MNKSVIIRARGRAVTLVELLVALTVLAVLSVAVTTMLRGAAQVSGAITTSMTSESEVEFTLHRVIQNVRMASVLKKPSVITVAHELELVTQPDAANATYQVLYEIVPGPDGTTQLQETDPRYGKSILISDLQTFDVRLQTADPPKIVLITLKAGKNPGVTRSVKIAQRNP